MNRPNKNLPSLENLVESENLGVEILHPGGLEITNELARMCGIGKETVVLDVASGTGESACHLRENFGCQVVGIDASDLMLEKAKQKAEARGLNIEFKSGDAHQLPFADATFDVVISECTTCNLDKVSAIREMARVTKPGGYVGIHDLCWKTDTPERLKHRLAEIENERPETLAGWKNLFERVRLGNLRTVDKSYLIAQWMKQMRQKFGLMGQLKIFLKIFKKWRLKGVWRLWQSEQIFQSKHLGYGIIVGQKN